MPSYDQRFRSYDLYKLECCWNSFLDRTTYLDKFIIWVYFQWKNGRTLNTGILEYFIAFLMRGRTQNFDFKRRSYDRLKLVGLTKISFGFNFCWIKQFSKFILFMHMHMWDHDKMPVLCIPHQKKSFAKYRWHTYNWWQITLIPIVSSNGMTYANVASVPTKEHNRYMTYITTYPPSGAHAFNAAWTSLYTI
jgi:hypothetical protein